MAAKRKKGISTYILPILFCGLLIVLAILKGRQADQPVKAVLQASEPLTLTDQAMENYLYSAGFTLAGETVLDDDGKPVASLTVLKGEGGAIDGMSLTFSVPTYYETKSAMEALAPLKANHDAAVQRGEDMFLALFDAIAATDGRVAARRDGAVEKLRAALNAGKASAQAANSWRFSFSLAPGEIEGTGTILFEKVK